MRKLLSSVALLLAITSFAQDTLSKQDIQSAARIQDLSFTPSEIDSMYDGVKDNWLIYQLQHKQSLNNSVPMSLWQNPVLPNMRLDQKQAEIKWNYIPNIQLPKDLNDLAYYNLLQLSSLLRNKKISSVQLTRFFIDRLKKYGDSLQCVISLTESIAMQQA